MNDRGDKRVIRPVAPPTITRDGRPHDRGAQRRKFIPVYAANMVGHKLASFTTRTFRGHSGKKAEKGCRGSRRRGGDRTMEVRTASLCSGSAQKVRWSPT
jgi:hypothetical protein